MNALRILAWILVGLGIALIGADAISTLEAGVPVLRTTQEILALLGLDVGLAKGGGIGRVLNFFLTVPLWAMIGLLGIVLTLMFRPID